VVSSRHSSAPAATKLKLPVFELTQPTELAKTLNSLLEALADEAGVHADNRGQWLRERHQRIERSRAAESDLWQVPLLATLLVLTIAARPLHETPTSRSALLTEVLDLTVERWEKRRPDASLPGTDDDLTPAVLLDCYNDIAHLAIGQEARWADAREIVTQRLRDHWNQSAGMSDVAAKKIIDFWDATAGIFITTSPQGELRPRSRLFAEIGEARWAVRALHRISPWMTHALQDKERRESARLAAGLSTLAADELVRQVLHHRGELLDLAYEARRDGAVFGADSLHKLREAQLDRLAHFKDDLAAQARRGFLAPFQGPESAQLAVRLADDELDATQNELLIRLSERLGTEQAAVVHALCACRQSRVRGTAMNQNELNFLEAGLPAPERNGVSAPHLAGIEDILRLALIHLLPPRPEVADRLAAASRRTTVGFFDWMRAELTRKGHRGVAKTMTRGIDGPIFDALQRAAANTSLPFLMLADLAPAGTELTPTQAWHLDEAAALVGAIGLAEAPAVASDRALESHRTLAAKLCQAILVGTGLPPSLVAAQIRSLAAEDDPNWGLLYESSTRLPPPDPRLVPIDVEVVLQALRSGTRWLCTLALDLAYCGDRESSSLPILLVNALQEFDAETKLLVSALVHSRWPHHSIPDADPVVRAGLARALAGRLAGEGRHSEAKPLLEDPDLLVRHEAAEGLGNIPASARDTLAEAFMAPVAQWTCRCCGTQQRPDDDSCRASHQRPPVTLKSELPS